jgi:membrane protease YdiL (CAAX protease family)
MSDASTTHDVPEPPSDSVELPLIAVVPLPKFCSVCGAPWNQDLSSCAACDARRATAMSGATTEPLNIRSALSLYFTLLGVSIAGLFAAAAHAPLVMIEFVLTGVSAVAVLIWCLGNRRDVTPLLSARPHPGWFLAAAGLGCCTFVVASALLMFLNRALHLQVLQYSTPFLHAGYSWNVVILVVAVMPAIFEELAFRGVILASLSRVLSQGEAILVSALMFMVLHLMVPSFPHLLLMGVVLAYLRFKSRSLLPGMLLHFTHNLLCVLSERYTAFDWFK